MRIGSELGEWFKTTVGTRQGHLISPTTCITYLERVMDSVRNNGTGVSVQGHKINNLKFADDIDLLEETETSCKETWRSSMKQERQQDYR